ncbi:M20/M25/M40 family metallo-hydrolase [Microbacterium yannicii]|uniref:M20/M25/M40 family metallo-hydrolase n=1 Tax=Microbacterium yannicii TaxID=671622 RepID=UPI0002D6B3C9|nr:M20/M25/M40 family metallo-hydrolase [Microbacterium yannicii]
MSVGAARGAQDRASMSPVAGGPSVSGFLAASTAQIVHALDEWIRIPSVAADPERTADMLRSARWLRRRLRDAGLSSRLLRSGESAAVYAEWLVDPDLPTVLVYSHHDVRHAKAEEWHVTSPFAPTVRDNRLFGRGASDAKGQVMAHLWGLRAHLAATGRNQPAVNLKLLVEGEEEIGSPHLAELLDRHRTELSCDIIVFSDTVQWQREAPAVVTSMRGVITGSLSITGAARDLHSGAVSGAAVNATHVLAEVVGGLHDAEGRVTLPGFYDDVAPLTPERREELAELPYDDDSWTARTETRGVTGEAGYTVPERLWERPSIEVLSLLAGDPEGIARAVIPATAQAGLSIRTVPNQKIATVAEQLREYVRQRTPETVTYSLEVDEELSQPPYVTRRGVALDCLERAIAAGFERPTGLRMGNAGGGPADLLARTLDADVLFLGTGLPEDHWHAGDESIDIDMLLRGAASIAHLWSELGAMRPADLR